VAKNLQAIEYFEELKSLMMCELVQSYHSIKAARRNSKLKLEVIIVEVISKLGNRSIKRHIIHRLAAMMAVVFIVVFE